MTLVVGGEETLSPIDKQVKLNYPIQNPMMALADKAFGGTRSQRKGVEQPMKATSLASFRSPSSMPKGITLSVPASH